MANSESDLPAQLFRSPFLMNRDDSALIVIDVQERLLPHIEGRERLLWNIGRLIDGATALGINVVATEQYPKGLGATTKVVSDKLNLPLPEKLMFSCRECDSLVRQFQALGIRNLLLAGIETHVCVAQSALDYMAAGFNVFVCVDAVGSRFSVDREIAIRRMESCGVIPTTTEAALFEWCEKAGTPELKIVSQLATATCPDGE